MEAKEGNSSNNAAAAAAVAVAETGELLVTPEMKNPAKSSESSA